LYCGGQELSQQALTNRRRVLELLATEYALPIPRQFHSPSSDQLSELFDQALANGSQGLILKKENGTYEYGQRSTTWLKWKRPAGRISTMLMYAHRNTSRPDQMCTEFTLGVCVREDPRYQETFIPIARSVKGLSSDQIQEINKRLPELTAEKYGSTYGLYPKIGIEVVFDEIRTNSRTKAKYVLRNAVAKSVIWETSPETISTLKDVEELYQMNNKGKEVLQDRHPSVLF
jgi:DNA ligase-1